MTVFEFSITVTKNTTEEEPNLTRVKLHPGVINQISWFWAPGTQALGHLVVLDGKHQVYPDNANGDLTSDGELLKFNDDYELKRPARLAFKAWNDDDTFSHLVIVRLSILKKPTMLDVMRKMQKALDLMTFGEEQEA